MKYILAISQQRGMKRTAEESKDEDESEDEDAPDSSNESMEESTVLSWKLFTVFVFYYYGNYLNSGIHWELNSPHSGLFCTDDMGIQQLLFRL